MKQMSIIIALAISCCAYSKVPELPTPKEGKHAIQIIRVYSTHSPDVLFETNNLVCVTQYVSPEASTVLPAESLAHPTADKILNDPDSEIFEYPVLYAAIGSSVTNDQTDTVMFPKDYIIEDGKAVPQKTPIKLGISIATTLTAYRPNVVKLKLDFYSNKLKGYDEYTTEEGVKVRMPFFEKSSFDTNVSMPLGGWVVLGGLVDSNTVDGSRSVFYLVRVK
jgi:hypothetical protein